MKVCQWWEVGVGLKAEVRSGFWFVRQKCGSGEWPSGVRDS